MRNVEFAELRRKSHTIVKVEFLSKKSIFTKLVLSNYNLKRFTGLFVLGLFCLYFRKIYPREIKRKLRNQEKNCYFGGKIQILSISSKYRIICSWTFLPTYCEFFTQGKKVEIEEPREFFFILVGKFKYFGYLVSVVSTGLFVLGVFSYTSMIFPRIFLCNIPRNFSQHFTLFSMGKIDTK